MPSGRENTWPGRSRLKAATGATSSRDASLVMSTPCATGAAGYSFRPGRSGEAARRLGRISHNGLPGMRPSRWPRGVPARCADPGPRRRSGAAGRPRRFVGRRMESTVATINGQPAGRVPAGLAHGVLAVPAGGGQGPARRLAPRRAAAARRHLGPRRGLPGPGGRVRARGGPGRHRASRARPPRPAAGGGGTAGPGRPGGGRGRQPGVPRGRLRGRRHRRGRRPVPAPHGGGPGRGDRAGAAARG